MKNRGATPGILPSQHLDPAAAERSRHRAQQLASVALEDIFEKRRAEQAAIAAAYRDGQASGREEGYETRFAEDYGLGLTVGIICTSIIVALLLVALAMHNPAGCLP